VTHDINYTDPDEQPEDGLDQETHTADPGELEAAGFTIIDLDQEPAHEPPDAADGYLAEADPESGDGCALALRLIGEEIKAGRA